MITKLDSHQRILYPVADIKFGTRVRSDYGDVDGLAQSIKENGLIHPIVINTAGVLIAGGRRFTAMTKVLGWTEVPINYFEFADEATLRILEREENVRRKQMTWQEEVISIAEVHSFHSLNAALASKRWTQRATGEMLNMSEANVSYTLQLADLIRAADKEIMACKVVTDAIHLLVKRRSEASIAIVAKLTLPKADPAAAQQLLAQLELGNSGGDSSIYSAPPGPTASGGVSGLADDGEMPTLPSTDRIIIPLSKMLIKGDSVDILEQFAPESVDHVITDWPYAEDMDNIQQSGGGMNIESVRAEHDVYANEALHKVMVPLIYKVLKPNGFFITWCDYMQWQTTYDLCIKAGFKVQRWPLTWYKTSRCQNMAANFNFTKNAEIAIVCRKGNGTLVTPQGSSVWPGSNEAEEKLLGHPFAKPFKLWEWLYSAVCIRGQTVLDPFAGRGSSTLAALNYGINPIAIEKNDAHYPALVVNVSEWYQKTLRNVDFS